MRNLPGKARCASPWVEMQAIGQTPHGEAG